MYLLNNWFINRKNLFHRVFEMDAAYVHPTSDVKQPSSLSEVDWRKQFSLMVRGKAHGPLPLKFNPF